MTSCRSSFLRCEKRPAVDLCFWSRSDTSFLICVSGLKCHQLFIPVSGVKCHKLVDLCFLGQVRPAVEFSPLTEHTNTSSYTQAHARACAHTHTGARAHTRAHTQACARARTHTHIHTPGSLAVSLCLCLSLSRRLERLTSKQRNPENITT